MATTKDERLQIRLNPTEKALLERGAAAAHLNVSAFVLQAAAVRAEEILADRQNIQLSPEAVAAFTQALQRPAAVNERLRQALRRPRRLAWID